MADATIARHRVSCDRKKLRCAQPHSFEVSVLESWQIAGYSVLEPEATGHENKALVIRRVIAVKIAARLGKETMVTVKWIAERLGLGKGLRRQFGVVELRRSRARCRNVPVMK